MWSDWQGNPLIVAVFLAAVAPSQPAVAAPFNPALCNSEGSGTAIIEPHSLHPQPNWQREGRGVDITLAKSQAPTNPRVVACFRWALQDWQVPGAADFRTFVSTDIVPATLDSNTGALKATVTVPTMPVWRPRSEAVAKPGTPIGKYSRNNTYANADVRVLVLGDGDTPVAVLTGLVGVVEADNYCDIPGQQTTAGSGIGSMSEHKNWQPVGGVFEFTASSLSPIPREALIKTCFRWKLIAGDPGRFHESTNPQLLDSQPSQVKVAATVPEIPGRPSWFKSSKTKAANPDVEERVADFAVLGIAVPRADTRVLVFDVDSSPLVDVTTTVGITQLWFASAAVICIITLILALLSWVCSKRLPKATAAKYLLCLVTTRHGYASLSQFQIVLWTFVVLASVIYVIALSGDLIEITTGTLVLLGISGTATVVAKAKSENDQGKPASIPDPVAAAEEASIAQYEAEQLRSQVAPDEADNPLSPAKTAADEAEAKAAIAGAKAALANATAAAVKARSNLAAATDDAAKQVAADAVRDADNLVLQRKQELAIASARAAKIVRERHPRWSDLIMEESQGRELDVTRVQMLCFTAVSAIFVLLTVSTNYAIPEIPQGYLILMGISNGVYVTSKFAAKN